jgi:CheY-like chemotaxis protein
MARHILVADDSTTMRRAVAIAFARGDWRVTAVATGAEALARARADRPDLCFIDAGLGSESGYEVCAALKGDAALGSVPVVLLTSSFHPFDHAQAARCGVDAHVEKPFETQALLDRAAALFGAAGAPAEAEAVAAPAAPASGSIAAVAAAAAAAVAAAAAAAAAPPAEAAMEGDATVLEPMVAGAPGAVSGAVTPVMGTPVMPQAPPSVPAVAPRPVARAIQPPPVRMPTPAAPTRPAQPADRTGSEGARLAQAARASSAPPAPVAVPVPAAPRGPVPVPPADRTGAGGPRFPAAAEASAPLGRPPLVGSASPQAGFAAGSATERIARKIGELAGRGPEYEAVVRLGREVIEQVVWEIVPELAELIIREEIDRLVAARRQTD